MGHTEFKIKTIFTLFFIFLLVSCGNSVEQKNKHLDKGVSYLEGNELDKARVEFKNALQIDPKFAQAYYYMGQLEEKNKQIQKALSYYRGSIELAPSFVKPKIKTAKIYVVSGLDKLIEEAVNLLDEVLVLEPNNAEVRLILATVDYKLGKPRKAIKSIEDLIQDEPKMVEAISLLSAIFSKENNINKSLQVLKEGIANQPADVSLRMSYAKQLSKDGQKVLAEKQLLRIVLLSPTEYSSYLMLSNFYIAYKEYDKAEITLRKALSENPNDVSRYQGLFEFIASRNDLEKVEIEILNAVINNPELYELQFLLSDFYKSMGNKNKSIQVLEELIVEREYAVESVTARIKLSEIYFEDKNIKEVDKLLSVVLNEYPDNHDALLIKSKISLINKDALTAINSLRIVFKSQPNNMQVAMLLANAYVMDNNNELAEKVLKQSLENNPTKHQAVLNYAKFLSSKKRYSEAYVFLDTASMKFIDNYEILKFKMSLASFINDEDAFLATLTIMQKKYKNNTDVFIATGRFFLDKKEYLKAIQEFEKAYSGMKSKYLPLELIISVYLKQNNIAGAIDKLKALLDKEKSESNALVYQFLGKLYVKQGSYIEARDNFTRALEITPQWDSPYLELASLYLSNNEIERAINVYKEAVNNNIKSESVFIQLASLYEKTKQTNEAIALYDNMLNSGSRNLMVKNNLALLLVQDKAGKADLDRATQLTKAFKNIKQPNFRDTLAWIYIKNGDNEEAVAVLRSVVESSPKVSIYKYHLAVALNNIVERIEAEKLLVQALKTKQLFVGRNEAVALFNQLSLEE